jgi:hypothetical protein
VQAVVALLAVLLAVLMVRGASARRPRGATEEAESARVSPQLKTTPGGDRYSGCCPFALMDA